MDTIDLLLLLVLLKTVLQAVARKLKVKLRCRGVIGLSRVGSFIYYALN